MKEKDLTFLKPYFGKWVALSSDGTYVVAASRSLMAVHKKVLKLKYKDAIYFKVVKGPFCFGV